jgi:hypothetical protein
MRLFFFHIDKLCQTIISALDNAELGDFILFEMIRRMFHENTKQQQTYTNQI